MDKEQLLAYLKENLRVEVLTASEGYGDIDVVVRLMLEGEVLSEDRTEIKAGSYD